MRFPNAVFFLGVCFFAAPVAAARAQDDARSAPQILQEAPADSSGSSIRQLRALQNAKLLAARGRSDEAIAQLESYLKQNGDDPTIVRELVGLYQDARRFSELEKLLKSQLAQSGGVDVGTLRLLAQAQFELGKDDEGIANLRKILKAHEGEPSYARMVATVLGRYKHDDDALAVLLQARKQSHDPNALAQQLGSTYLRMGKPVEAVGEYLRVILDTPMNVELMRAQILDVRDAHPKAAPAIRATCEKIYQEHPAVPELGLVLGELRQLDGESQAAWEVIEPLLDMNQLKSDLLQMALAGLAESRLPASDSSSNLKRLRLSQRILAGLLSKERLPRTLQPRAFDALTRTWIALLANSSFDELSKADQKQILNGARTTLLTMMERFPNDKHTTDSLLRLARAYVELLHQPEDAIALYRRIQMNPNVNVDDMETARVGLGQAYMAAGDTTQARTLFETMGRDMNFVDGQGRAHFHLGQLDFMGGEFERAKDRLRAVAFEAPSASYTNDALDLALLLAEESMGDNDQAGLRRYGRALYFKTVGENDSLLTQLKILSEKKSPVLRARAQLDLAQYWSDAGKTARALAQVDSLLSQAPDSRLAPRALELQGDLLLRQGKSSQARAAYARLLENYEDYIFIETVRDKIRGIDAAKTKEKGNLP